MAGKIKTVVVLVQENRSFDHMLGWMKSLNPEIDGVTGAEFNHAVAGNATSPAVHFGNASQYVDPDPGHSFMAIYEQVYGDPYAWGGGAPATKPGVAAPPMSGFAQQAEKEKPGMSATVMNGFRPDAVPVYRELVREFAVCDRWFASVPTSTQPNRMFVHSATSHGLVGNDKNLLRAGMPQRTIFDALHDAGHSFGIYYQFPPAVLFYRNMRQLKYLGKLHPYDIDFKRHCKEGKLPNYVVIEQRYLDLKPLLRATTTTPRTTSPTASASSRRSTRRSGRARSGTRPSSSSPTTSTAGSSTTCPPQPRASRAPTASSARRPSASPSTASASASRPCSSLRGSSRAQ